MRLLNRETPNSRQLLKCRIHCNNTSGFRESGVSALKGAIWSETDFEMRLKRTDFAGFSGATILSGDRSPLVGWCFVKDNKPFGSCSSRSASIQPPLLLSHFLPQPIPPLRGDQVLTWDFNFVA